MSERISRGEAVRLPSQWHLLIVALLLALAFAGAVVGAASTSITIDEGGHLVFGYSVLQTGDWRMLEQHPPLVRELSGWPMLLIPDLTPARDMPGWAESDRLRMARALTRYLPVDRIVFASRVPIALLSILLGAFVYRWAADWGRVGKTAGLLALGLYAFDPNMLANAQVVTTDLGAACFIFIALYFLQRFLRRPTWGRLLIAGFALGLSQSSKHSAVLLPPLVCLLVTFHALLASPSPVLNWPAPRSRRTFLARLMLALMIILLVAFASLWATYGFTFKQPAGWPLPVPAGWHIESLLLVQQHMADGHPEFLFGQVGTRGWWWYFPFTFAVKTPLPTLILLGASLIGLISILKSRSSKRRLIWRGVLLGAFPITFFLSTLFSTVTIGYRHILPILPFIFVFIGNQIANLKAQASSFRSRIGPLRFYIWYLIFGILLAWYLYSAITIFPFPTGYFNELVGGPDNGWKYLADSNTEWGQSVKALKAFMDARKWPSIKLSIFSFTDPAAYGLSYEPLPPMKDTSAVLPSRLNPPPGRYAISATTLDGIPLADPEQFDWFRRREPTARLAHVMFIYDVPPADPPRAWVAQCTTPVTPLEPSQIAEGFGRGDLRLAYFDCVNSWLYPSGGKSRGWYVLAREAMVSDARWLAQARLSYEQTRTGFAPPFRIYEADSPPSFTGGRARVAPTEQSMAEAVNKAAIDLPVTFENGLTLLSFTLDHSSLKPGETAHLETVWRVDRMPDRLLSIMAHALAPDGRVLAVGDGLGVPLESWQPGDVFIQRHTLTIPKDALPGSYWIQTGIYWLDDGKRWPVRDARAMGDRALLMMLQVQ